MSDKTFLDWPFFEDSHRQLAQTCESWALAAVPGITDQHDTNVDRICQELVAAMGEAGWLTYCVPESCGGRFARLDVRSLCLIRETFARVHPLADFSFAMQGLGSGPMSLAGSTEQQQTWLPRVASGKAIAAFALSEPEAGSDVGALSTEAVKKADGYVLNGEKTFISNGGIADFYTLFARTGEAPGARGISCFLVEADNPGLEIAERIDLMAPHPLARLRLNDLKLTPDALIGEPGRGFQLAMSTLDIFRSTVGAAALGMARRGLEETLARIESRAIFGGVLSDLPTVQAKVGDMALDVDASALLVYRSAWTKDCVAERVSREAAMAKLYATEAAQRVIDTAVQLHGGLGVTRGNPVEALYRDIRALRIYEGASEIQQTIIARQVLGSGG